MLILRRKTGEEIIINETTTIRILSTTDGSCSIGIDAPKSDHIRRGELLPESERIIQKTALSLELVE